MGCLITHDVGEDSSLNNKFKVVLIGLQNSGKTSILNYLVNNKFAKVGPTVGLNIESLQYMKKNYVFFDVSGKARSLWPHYYENLGALIFVIDTSDKEQIYNLRDELIKVNKDLEYHTVSKFRILISLFKAILFYLNKCDLPQTSDVQQLIEELGIYQFIDQDVIIQKCSAKTGEGIWEGLSKLHSFSAHKQKKGMLIASSNLTTNQYIKKEPQ